MIERHLAEWLGAWPGEGYTVVGCARRVAPAWNGRPYPVIAVLAPDCGVLSVPPHRAQALHGLAPERWREVIPGLVPLVFRFTQQPAPLGDAGTWVPSGHPALPEWLRPFGPDVLAALEGDAFLAAVGLKRHDRFGWEIAVGTAEHARGRGLARRLVAQAARHVLARGAIPTYAHELDHDASARVAEAAGFPDAGWRLIRSG